MPGLPKGIKTKFNTSDMFVEAWDKYKEFSFGKTETHKNKKEFIDLAIAYGANMEKVFFFHLYYPLIIILLCWGPHIH